MDDQDGVDPATVPTRFEVSVVLCRRPLPDHRWVKEFWEVIGVVHGGRLSATAAAAKESEPDPPAPRQLLCSGLVLSLHRDEAESYYHNLMAPTPRLYVLTRTEQGVSQPEPFHVTVSFDEAHAYLEGEDDVHQVPMPEEILPWVERFVLDHYRPQPRRKRKRRDWKKESPR